MDVLRPRCCGLDIGKKTASACISIIGKGGKVEKQTQSFSSMTKDILALMDWLSENGVTHVAMEATGSYWKPFWNLLEEQFEVTLVNPQHMKAVPGRKTDVKDAEWIAQLHQYGLLPRSFVPEKPQRELRELVRYRKKLVEERASEVNRLQKTLEGANIKLASVASNVLGASGRAILDQLAEGITVPSKLVELAKGRLKGKKEALADALQGIMQPHQRYMISRQLTHIDDLAELIDDVNQEIAKRIDPFEDAVARLMTIPGVGRRTAEVIIAEVGADVSPFPSAQHLAAWAGLAPGNKESAGKKMPARTRQGNHSLKSAMVEAAWAASHTKGTFLAARFQRLAKRLKGKKALVAVAHLMIEIVYHLLKDKTEYQEKGADYYVEMDRKNTEKWAIRRLEELGYDVKLESKIAPVA